MKNVTLEDMRRCVFTATSVRNRNLKLPDTDIAPRDIDITFVRGCSMLMLGANEKDL